MSGRIDILLVNWHSAAGVAAAVARLRPEGRPWPHGTIRVVDNSVDADEAARLAAALPPEVELLVMPRNGGFGAGCNAAWARSTAPYALLLNPDALIDPEAVTTLAAVLEAHPHLAAVSPRTWWDRIGGWVLPCPTPQDPWARWRRAQASRRAPAAWATAQAQSTRLLMQQSGLIDVPTLAGAVLMLRRRAVQSAEPVNSASGILFDERYFMYFEDAELSQRLRRAGWRLALVPTVDAVHTWRHQPHKAPLMASGEAVYLQGQPLVYRWLRKRCPHLERTGRLGDPGPGCRGAAEAAASLGEVLALSPSPSGDPAWVRADGRAAILSNSEWALLEPGSYWAWTASGGEEAQGGNPGPWRGFERLPD